MPERDLVEALAARGVIVPAGSPFFPTPPRTLGFRLSCVNLKEPQIEEGIRRLGRALKDLLEE